MATSSQARRKILRVGKRVDALFANSQAETKTNTEKAFAQSFADQVGNVGAIVRWVLSALFGLLTIAVASLELSQTVLEEEVQREASMSTPTRARRVLSRFMLVVVVSLSVEFLVLVFELIHHDTSRLPHAAAVGFGAAALLAGWALFVKYNAEAEKLEPEAMEQVKREDDHVG